MIDKAMTKQEERQEDLIRQAEDSLSNLLSVAHETGKLLDKLGKNGERRIRLFIDGTRGGDKKNGQDHTGRI